MDIKNINIREIPFDQLVDTLEEIEQISKVDTNMYPINLDSEYIDMYDTFYGNPEFRKQRWPYIYRELRGSYDKDKLIDFISFLGINTGYGTGDEYLNNLFYMALFLRMKGSTGK